MALPNGICKYLDENTNLCLQYSIRPIFCNVDAFYDKFLSKKISREEFYLQNEIACNHLMYSKKENHEPVERIITINEMPLRILKKFEDLKNVTIIP